jgi:hypothetical protein
LNASHSVARAEKMRQTENQPIGIHLSFESANRNNVLRQMLLLEHFECAYAAQIIKYIEKGIHNKKDSLNGSNA